MVTGKTNYSTSITNLNTSVTVVTISIIVVKVIVVACIGGSSNKTNTTNILESKIIMDDSNAI